MSCASYKNIVEFSMIHTCWLCCCFFTCFRVQTYYLSPNGATTIWLSNWMAAAKDENHFEVHIQTKKRNAFGTRNLFNFFCFILFYFFFLFSCFWFVQYNSNHCLKCVQHNVYVSARLKKPVHDVLLVHQFDFSYKVYGCHSFHEAASIWCIEYSLTCSIVDIL